MGAPRVVIFPAREKMRDKLLDVRAALVSTMRAALASGDYARADAAHAELVELREAGEAAEARRIEAAQAAARAALSAAQAAWARGPSSKTRAEREDAYLAWRAATRMCVVPECLRV